ncbi:MAG: zinc ABC transporter substrate-binding protein [Deltaproteobacteria bacterium]|nr:zinc ABC transporter substrate-binding protein [Deltaproteobacteria bacterium]
MKKLLILFLVTISPLSAIAKLNIVTTTPDLAALAKEVGGDRVAVISLARGDQDPHYLEPKPSYAVKLNRADLLIAVGLDLEIGWLPVLLTQSRNPKIQPGSPGYLEPTSGVRILEIPHGPIDRSQGDVHPLGNPHYWLDPRNGLVIASQIASRLKEIDPEGDYAARFFDFEKRLKARIAVWEKETAPLRGKRIVTHHKSFSYFVDWVGLQVAGLVEPKPGIPPPPSHLLKLINQVRQENISLLVTENYYDPKPSREIGQKTGAKVLILPTSVGGEAGVGTYEALFDRLIRKLKEGLP